MGFAKKISSIFCMVFGMATIAVGNPDWPPVEPASMTTTDYSLHIAYKRVWYQAGTGERIDGPTLVVRGPNINVTYAGNADYLKILASSILSAKAMGKPVTFHYDKQNWVILKYLKSGATVGGEPDWLLDGNRNSYGLLRIEVK